MKFSILALLVAIVHSQVTVTTTTDIETEPTIVVDPTTSMLTPEPSTTSIPPPRPSSGFCTGPSTYRKEVRQMKADGDLDKFTSAFAQLAANGVLLKYVNWHGPSPGYWNFAHFNPMFLPFHRCYLKELEKELQALGCPYLPYWDSAIDANQPWLSPILTGEYFGTIDDTTKLVIDGPFANNVYTAPTGGPLKRDYPKRGRTSAFYSHVLTDRILNNAPDFSNFSITLEYGPHVPVHDVIGGDRGQMSTWQSPVDPIFWLHHCFMDKLWFDYQLTEGLDFNTRAYGPKWSFLNMETLIQPWNVAVSSVLDVNEVGATYIEPNLNVVKPANGTSNDTVIVPTVSDRWFNNTGANLTIATGIVIQSGNIAKVENANPPPKSNGSFQRFSSVYLALILSFGAMIC